MKLKKGEAIVAVVAEEASGPGWANPVYWIYIREVGGGIREESLQPNEQPPALILLHPIAARMTKTLLAYLLEEKERLNNAPE